MGNSYEENKLKELNVNKEQITKKNNEVKKDFFSKGAIDEDGNPNLEYYEKRDQLAELKKQHLFIEGDGPLKNSFRIIEHLIKHDPDSNNIEKRLQAVWNPNVAH